MLSFSLPKAVCLPIDNSSEDLPLDKNVAFNYLSKLDLKLRAAKDSMEPYFKRYEKKDGRNIFKTVTSNFESFKFTRNQIAQNRNTPSVSNAWIKAYELISEFNLVPDTHTLSEDNRMQWNHFDNCSFPGSFVLAVYHYVYTKRDAEFQSKYNWFASSLLAEKTQDAENPEAALGDQYELYKRYPDNWLMEPENDLNGDILNPDYIAHIGKMLGVGKSSDASGGLSNDGQVDLYTSEFGVDVSESKKYNEQEFVHSRGDLAQIICGFKTLRKDGHMVCKIFTFFNPFTLSMIALMRECFVEFYICKPISSKPDNSEVFLIGKEFKPKKGVEAAAIMLEFLLNKESDYRSGQLVPLNRLDEGFWKRIKESAYKIFEELQISRITNNIVVFDKIIAKCGDPTNNKDIEDKVKRMSREEYQTRIEDDNKCWFAAYPVLVLRKNHRLNIIDITERTVKKDAPARPRYGGQSGYNNQGGYNNYNTQSNQSNENKMNRTSFNYSTFGRTSKY